MAKVRTRCKGGSRTFKSRAAKGRYEAYKHIHVKPTGGRKKK
jgi:hypothetical protein